MRSPYVVTVLALAWAARVAAQVETITLPWANGDTVVVSVNADDVTRTLSTVTGGGAATITRRPGTNQDPDDDDEDQDGPPTKTGPRVVGQDTTAAPMRTTTYWYDPGDNGGVWVSQVWTASVTAAPQEATAIVPEGTIQDYNSYQTRVNSVVLKSAEAAEAGASGRVEGNINGGASRRAPTENVLSLAAGWTGVVVSLIGVGFGIVWL